MNILRKALLAVAFGVTSAAAAQAHALLESANPRVGSTISAVPSVLTLSFTEGIEPAFSTVQVTDSAGRRVDAGKLRVNGRQVQVPLRPSGPGQYNVRWRVLSVDTHTTEGSFRFEVRP